MGPGHACQSTQSLEAYGVRHLAYSKLAFFPQLLCQTRQETVPRSLVSAHRSGMDPRTRSIVPATNLGSKQKQNPYGATHLLKFHLYLCIYIPRRVNIFQFWKFESLLGSGSNFGRFTVQTADNVALPEKSRELFQSAFSQSDLLVNHGPMVYPPWFPHVHRNSMSSLSQNGASPGAMARSARHSAQPSAQVPWILGKQLWLKRAERVSRPPPAYALSTGSQFCPMWRIYSNIWETKGLICGKPSFDGFPVLMSKILGKLSMETKGGLWPVPRCKALVNATPAAVFGLAWSSYPSPMVIWRKTLTYLYNSIYITIYIYIYIHISYLLSNYLITIPTWDPNKSSKIHLESVCIYIYIYV